MSDQAVGLYLHIPFCVSKCAYCDFYSVPINEEIADAYTRALIRAMETHPFGDLRADTLYLGGGTPSLLGAKRLCAILESAAACFGLDGESEISLEVNPESVTRSLLEDLRKAGYNRLSVGVQSGNDAELLALSRAHDLKQAREAILAGHSAGFENISADLMLAIPGQSAESLSESIAFLTAMPLDHISAYILKLEPGCKMWQKKEALRLPDEDQAASFYLQCAEELAQAGFEQYEISNFARPGGESRHNLKYWRRQPYLGIGPAAHSFLPDANSRLGARFSFLADIAMFIAAKDPFELLRPEDCGPDMEEEIMLRLRLREGFDTSPLTAQGMDAGPLLKKAERLAGRGLCRVEGGVISLTAQGFLVSNTIILELLQILGA